jgi:N-acetylmuramoyl-L-alanine amidase
MMETILSFSVKSMMCSAVFVGYYMVALKNAQVNGFNRAYLLGATLLSLLLPMVPLQLFSIAAVTVPDITLLPISGEGAAETMTHTNATKAFDWKALLTIAYAAVAIAMVVKLIMKFAWVYRLKAKGHEENNNGYSLVRTDDPRAPFSFMNMLFWPKHMRQDSPEGRRIWIHEMVHIRQRHTLDKLAMELMVAACWLNPFNWFIKKELCLQHEFLADRQAIADGDGETFARMLLYSVNHTQGSTLISPFFQSPVKRRLLMLAKPGKATYHMLRRLLCLPVLLSAICLVAARPADHKVIPAQKKIKLVLDAAHGGEDVGGTGIYGQQEKDLTLAISKKMVALSKEYNIDVVTTRDGDEHPTLEERVHTSNNTDNAIFLSLHVSKNVAGEAKQVSYELGINPNGVNHEKSLLLASAIGGKLKTLQLPVKVVEQHRAFVIRESKHPALLMECGNIDNADNIALLIDAARMETLCRNILSGIVEYGAKVAQK